MCQSISLEKSKKETQESHFVSYGPQFVATIVGMACGRTTK